MQKHARKKEYSSYGMLERCSVADGGKILLKFLDPGFLKRWRAEPEKSRVSACSSCPLGSCTTGCFDNITLITLPWRRWPFRWLIAVIKKYEETLDKIFKSVSLSRKLSMALRVKHKKRNAKFNVSQTKLSLSGVAHLNKSVFLLIEEDFHSLNVPINTWKDTKTNFKALSEVRLHVGVFWL